jgi:hypothetical protein
MMSLATCVHSGKGMIVEYLRKTRAVIWSSLVIVFAVLACAVSAQAQVTSLTFVSDPGDYIGGGQFSFFTSADGTFTAGQNYDQGVSLSFIAPSYEHWWNLDFAAPNNQPLTAGTYTGAVRFPFQTTNQAGLSVYGDGRGCNTLTGSFQVLEVTYGAANDILSFDATFEQHCEGVTPALRGEIRYNASVVVNVTAPTHVSAYENQNLNLIVNAVDAQSRHVVLTATGLPAGASFVDNGDNTGTFNWTPTSNQVGTYLLTFNGDNQQGNTGVTYTQVIVTPPPPPNDDFDHPMFVPSIPFSITEDATNATIAPDDPFSCYSRNQTVWFAYTPDSNIGLEANTFGSNYDTTLTVYTGPRGALSQIGCNDDAGGTWNSRVRFDAVAGTTYYFMVSSLYPTPSANLVFNLLEGPPPFSFASSVSQFGSVKLTTGEATITGSAMCTAPAYVTIYGQLKQMHAGTPISGYFSTFVPCNGTTPWSATVQTQAALFHGRSAALFVGGKANLSATAYAFDPDTGEYKQVNLSVDVTLRGAK